MFDYAKQHYPLELAEIADLQNDLLRAFLEQQNYIPPRAAALPQMQTGHVIQNPEDDIIGLLYTQDLQAARTYLTREDMTEEQKVAFLRRRVVDVDGEVCSLMFMLIKHAKTDSIHFLITSGLVSQDALIALFSDPSFDGKFPLGTSLLLSRHFNRFSLLLSYLNQEGFNEIKHQLKKILLQSPIKESSTGAVFYLGCYWYSDVFVRLMNLLDAEEDRREVLSNGYEGGNTRYPLIFSLLMYDLYDQANLLFATARSREEQIQLLIDPVVDQQIGLKRYSLMIFLIENEFDRVKWVLQKSSSATELRNEVIFAGSRLINDRQFSILSNLLMYDNYDSANYFLDQLNDQELAYVLQRGVVDPDNTQYSVSYYLLIENKVVQAEWLVQYLMTRSREQLFFDCGTTASNGEVRPLCQVFTEEISDLMHPAWSIFRNLQLRVQQAKQCSTTNPFDIRFELSSGTLSGVPDSSEPPAKRVKRSQSSVSH